VWTWIAIDADSKLVPAWFVGQHTAEDGFLFMMDLKHRLACYPQITTDGLKSYAAAIGFSFGSEVDWALLQKHYGADPGGEGATAPASAPATTSRSSAATRTPRRSAPATSSARTSRCEWGCSAARG